MLCNLGAGWPKILEFVLSRPIYGWRSTCGLIKSWGLAWWCDFFPVGPTFEDHPQIFGQKKSSPLDFIFDTCASTSSNLSRSLFFVGETEHMCLYTFAGTSVSSARKHLFCNLGARWYNIFNFVLSYLIYGWRPTLWPNQSLESAWWGDIFLVGPTFKNHPQVFGKKKKQPLGFYFWHLHLDLLKSFFFVGETEHMCLFPFVGANALSVLPAFHGCIFYL